MKDEYLDEGMRGWIVNTARKEHWRVKELLDFDDLIQDGYLVFYKCRNRYVGKKTIDAKGNPHYLPPKHPNKDQRRHFQALVKTAFSNHICTIAAKHKGVSESVVSQIKRDDTITDVAVWDKFLPQQPEQASVVALILNAPAEIKQLITLLANDGLDLLNFERRRVGRRLIRETNNEFYCRLLGLNPETHDIVGRLKEYFG